MSDSVRPHRRQPIRLLHPWDSPGKNTGVGCHFLLQRRLSTAELKLWNCGTREDSWESLDWKVKPVNPKGINPEYSLEAPLLELQLPILWPLDARSWLTGKDLCWEDWRQKKREAKNKMVRQHHQHNGHKSEQTLGDSGGQRSLVCCSPQGHRAGHNSVTEQHNKKSYINTMLTD